MSTTNDWDIKDCNVAAKVWKETPALLTDLQIEQIEFIYGVKGAAEARKDRYRAINAPPALSPEQEAQVEIDQVNRKSLSAQHTTTPIPRRESILREGETLDDLSWDEIVRRAPLHNVPLKLFDNLRKFVLQINEKNQGRNVRLDALEAQLGIGRSAGPQASAVDRRVARPKVKHRGEWRNGDEYALNDCVVADGRLFRSTAFYVKSDPRRDPVCWQAIGSKREL